jgi:hypothetical protein
MNYLKFPISGPIEASRYIHERSARPKQPTDSTNGNGFEGASRAETGEPAKCHSARHGDDQQSSTGETGRHPDRCVGSRSRRQIVLQLLDQPKRPTSFAPGTFHSRSFWVRSPREESLFSLTFPKNRILSFFSLHTSSLFHPRHSRYTFPLVKTASLSFLLSPSAPNASSSLDSAPVLESRRLHTQYPPAASPSSLSSSPQTSSHPTPPLAPCTSACLHTSCIASAKVLFMMHPTPKWDQTRIQTRLHRSCVTMIVIEINVIVVEVVLDGSSLHHLIAWLGPQDSQAPRSKLNPGFRCSALLDPNFLESTLREIVSRNWRQDRKQRI